MVNKAARAEAKWCSGRVHAVVVIDFLKLFMFIALQSSVDIVWKVFGDDAGHREEGFGRVMHTEKFYE